MTRALQKALAAGVLAVFASACTGPQGATGADGTNGKDGTNGTNGKDGTNGTNGTNGTDGTNGKDAATTGVIAGAVTDSVAKDPLPGVAVLVADSGGTKVATATTDASGKFTATAPIGYFTVTFSLKNWTSPAPMSVGTVAGQTVNLAIALAEAASGKPSLAVKFTGNDFGYGGKVTLTAVATSPEDVDGGVGNTTLTYAWAQTTVPNFASVTVTPSQDGTSADVLLPTFTEALAPRVESLKTPGQFISGLTPAARFGVLPVLADTRGETSVALTVTDSRGQKTTASVTLDAASMQTGTRNVAIGTRVYLNSGHADPNTWALTAVPPNSKAALTLQGGTTQYPDFIPDLPGKYTLTEGVGGDAGAVNSIDLYAGTWVGAGGGYDPNGGSAEAVAANSDCTVCHDGTVARSENFASWVKTGHAQMLAKGLDGINGTSYGESCIKCHTVGYDKGSTVPNNGFVETEMAVGWTFPGPPYAYPANGWQTFATTPANAPLVKQAGIQCENCHGPNGNGIGTGAATGPAHKLVAKGALVPYTSAYQNPRISYSAEVCGTCHASGTGHHNYSEWASLNPGTDDPVMKGWGHSSRSGAGHAASGASTMSNHCSRCHSAQGFVEYLDQLTKGNVASATYTKDSKGNAVPPYTNTWNMPPNPGVLQVTAGVTGANVEPITCTACHDPHDATNPSQIRLYGDVPLLPAGFAFYGAGEGALCMACHNTRNSYYTVVKKTDNNGNSADTEVATYLHEDGDPTAANAAINTSTSPHDPAQADVFAGHNAYFIPAWQMPVTSKHAAIKDTCVACHMRLNPATHTSHGSPAVNTHQFRVMDADIGTLCSNCHGAGNVDGAGIQATVEALQLQLATKMGSDLAKKLNNLGTTYRLSATNYAVSPTVSTIAPAAAKNPSNLTPITIDPAQNPIVSAVPVWGSDTLYFTVTLTNAITLQYVDSNGVPSGAPVTSATFSLALSRIYDMNPSKAVAILTAQTAMMKANWNLFLAERDASKGLHNPTFVMSFLKAAIAADLTQ